MMDDKQLINEERLIEITSEICKTKDPLWITGYILSLNENDISLLMNIVSGSKYSGMTLYEALFNFSNEYLKSKGVEVKSQSANFVVDPFLQDKDAVTICSTYFDNMLKDDNSMQKDGRRHRR